MKKPHTSQKNNLYADILGQSHQKIINVPIKKTEPDNDKNKTKGFIMSPLGAGSK